MGVTKHVRRSEAAAGVARCIPIGGAMWRSLDPRILIERRRRAWVFGFLRNGSSGQRHFNNEQDRSCNLLMSLQVDR